MDNVSLTASRTIDSPGSENPAYLHAEFQEETRGLYRAGPLTEAARKPAFSRFQAIAASDRTSEPGQMVAHHQFIQGFAAFAASHPEVGEPIEDQWYKESPGGRTFAFQTTTRGLLIWSQQQNTARFAAFSS